MVDLRGRTVLVTGGAGFIGSHLVRALVERGVARVVVLDSLRYGEAGSVEDLPGVEVVEHALGSDRDSELVTMLTGVDLLFHLAAEKHNQSKDSPSRVIDANIKGTHALLEAASRCGVERVVFTSSLYAYGRMSGSPFVETEVPQPTTVYGITKLAGEHLLSHFEHRGALEGNVLRYLFVYGPRQYAKMGYKSVIVKSFERLMRNEAPVVYGDGSQTLDYVYVDDAVEATILAMETDKTGLTLNVGSGVGTKVDDLVTEIIAVSGKEVSQVYEPPDWTAGSRRVGDVRAIERELGWKASTSLPRGLRLTWEWMSARTRP